MAGYKHISKRVTAVVLSACLAAGGTGAAMATPLSNAESKKAEAQNNLDSVNGEIEDIQGQQSSLQAEIDALDADLVTTIANISILEDGIAQKEAELEQANADLEEAKKTEAEQYAAMKERISYMYTNGGDISFFNALLGADSFADVLNRVAMFASVYDVDRTMLQEYQETEAEIESLVTEIADEQAAMQDQQADLKAQKASLDSMVAEKSAQMDNFDEMLASAQSLAAEYKATIEEQNQVIAEEVAAQQRAAAEAEERAERTSSSETGQTVASDGGSSESNTNTDRGNSSNNEADDSSESESSSSGGSSSSSVSGSGQAVADYACQFVGNPYVWGGESLTNGADCSGFIKAVYAHFGVSLPHSSYSLRSVGRAVSASEMQPGDIVCYDGHVAIYIGGGRIVHASNAKDGIKISPNYAYRTVVAIRRIF